MNSDTNNFAGTYTYDTTGEKYNRLVSIDGKNPPLELRVRPGYIVSGTTRYFFLLNNNGSNYECNLYCDLPFTDRDTNPHAWQVGKMYRFITRAKDKDNNGMAYMVHVESEQVRIVRITKTKYEQLSKDFKESEQKRLTKLYGAI